MKLFGVKVTFGEIKKSDIAILYCDDYWLRALVLKNLEALTLPIYPERVEIYINFNILKKFFKHISSHKFEAGINIARRLYQLYIISWLDCASTKVVLTYIDNSDFFYEISEIDLKSGSVRIYMAVQNGARTKECVEGSRKNKKNIFSQKMILYCFGRRDVELYKAAKHNIGKHVPIGSLVSGYYKSVEARQLKIARKDICFISQWNAKFFKQNTKCDNLYIETVYKKNRESIKALVNFLNIFSVESSIKVNICLRSNNVDEESFYLDNFPQANIILRNSTPFTTYEVAERSEIVIALNSTVLSEVFLWDNKTLWCNPLKILEFSMPEAGISYVEGEYENFKERVLYLLKLSSLEYKKQTKHRAKYINSYNIENPPHLIIQNEIKRRLSSIKF
jgi:surface carbohydrate biosynthesis protein